MKIRPNLFVAINFVDYVRDKFNLFDNQENKIAKYWTKRSKNDVLEEADKLIQNERYMEVYETLNKIKYCNDSDVIWRLAKVLYSLSQVSTGSHEVRKEMIDEAYTVLASTCTIGQGRANYHKWMAIVSNTRNGMESLETRIKEYPRIKDHLEQACQSNPDDFTVQYMLGRWHYEMANLTWFQRQIAKWLFLEPPHSTYEEAMKYLTRAEEIQPRCYVPNVYMLGCAYMKLGQYYRAKYYLGMALNLPIHSECEQCFVSNAKAKLTKLEQYDLAKDLLFDNYSYVYDH